MDFYFIPRIDRLSRLRRIPVARRQNNLNQFLYLPAATLLNCWSALPIESDEHKIHHMDAVQICCPTSASWRDLPTILKEDRQRLPTRRPARLCRLSALQNGEQGQMEGNFSIRRRFSGERRLKLGILHHLLGIDNGRLGLDWHRYAGLRCEPCWPSARYSSPHQGTAQIYERQSFVPD